MILPEDRPESPSKLAQPDPPAQSTVPEAAPPAYPGYEAGSSRIAVGPPSETQPLNQPQPVYIPVFVKPPGSPERRARKRFIKAFFIAFLIYTLFCIFVGSIIEVTNWSQGGGHRYEREDSATAQPRPNDGKILSCIKGADHWTDNNGHLGTTFKLHRMSDVLYLFARGQQLTGNVMIIQDESLRQPDTVLVDVAAYYHTPDWLHVVQICSLERARGEQGVGIFSPTRWRSRSPMLPELEFHVTIRLPKLLRDEPIQIARLETNMPNFSQHIGDLRDQVLFRDLSLKSSNSHISSQSVRTFNAEIITSNSRIVGSYEASQSLRLVTENDSINVTATLVHLNPRAPGPVLRMKTSNRQIVSSVNLVSHSPPTPHRPGGSFNVEANTSNARLTLDFPVAPIDSVLNVKASTSNAKAHVKLHPAWEGAFSLRTTNRMTHIENPHRDDPGRQGRERQVAWFGEYERSDGLATWSGKYTGNVYLQTSNEVAQLTL